MGLVVVGAIAGGGEDHGAPERSGPFGYTMSTEQYAALQPGLDESVFVNRLEQAGLPENLTKERYVRLFPPHGDDITCSYWEIAGNRAFVARVCFSSPEGRLVQKLERSVAGAFGVTA